MLDEVQEQLKSVIGAFEAGDDEQLADIISVMDAQDCAMLLSASPPRLRNLIWELTRRDTRNQVIQHLGEDVRADLLEDMDASELAAAGKALDPDDFADILQQLPEGVTQQVLANMDARDRERLETVLSFPDDTAGGLMTTQMVSVRPRHSLELVLRYLRRFDRLPDATDQLMVVNSREEFVGVLTIAKLLTTDPSLTVRDVMDTSVIAINAHTDEDEVARRFAQDDLVSAPVIDDGGKLLGRITIDDVVDVINKTADESMLGRAGLDVDTDTFAPAIRSARRRAIWLGANLITAFFASAVIGLFQETIEKVVALAILMPIVASMGGVAGTQTLTLVVRGMAVGQIGRANLRWLLNRELMVALLNGLLWALIVAVGSAWVFSDLLLGAIIAAALLINISVGTLTGTLLPRVLEALDIDPAIAGGVVLTTVTDVAGFLAFLGLATIVYA